MTPEIHRAALRAAAKLALSAALPAFAAACGGETDAVESPQTATVASAPKENLHNVVSGTKEMCPKAADGTQSVDCCRQEVASATFPADATWSQNADLRVDSETRACCLVLANAASSGGGFAERSQCCEAIGWNAAGACTPWGPPVPPKMKSRGKGSLRGKRTIHKTPFLAA